MLSIDGSHGEGGGQILRSALALSLITRTPFHIYKIRAGRSRPGLMRQHLAAVRAAQEIGQAEVTGAQVGSRELSFRPKEITAGEYTFSIGTAGSATLVLQTVLPALLTVKEPSRLRLEGGTHNPHAPPFDFLARAYLPLVSRMGPEISARLERPGFYPAGGGRFEVDIRPAPLSRLELLERGAVKERRAVARVAGLPYNIAERELEVIGRRLEWPRSCLRGERLPDDCGPGNVVVLEVESEALCEVFCGFGEKGVRAELVAEGAARRAAKYLEAGVPVGEFLADQLLLPMALAGGGAFRTVEPSLHAKTHADVLKTFLGTRVRAEPEEGDSWRIEVEAPRGA